ncbi:GAF domain-containing protein [Pontibacter silvestris]|uniref:GAF domain-containing protein n=1 Tax=Pontibacter silvestris TaxID=2305183 RepID=A0ABW4X127_9BACT|nr:GAF domain-containing protein [Pontibacter silvestris]MCC9137557.1 GAF domain-containing protein [Pontibacter silvestris]
MQKRLMPIEGGYLSNSPFQIKLCFEQIISKLEQAAAEPENQVSEKELALLRDVSPFPELRYGLEDFSQIEQHADLINGLLADYFPSELSRNEIKAVSIPYTNIIFNRTERFSNIFEAAGPDFQFNIRDFDEHQFYVMSCCLILNQYYGTQLDFTKPLFYDIPTADGITKHYRILYNADFLEILPTEKSIALTQEDINLLMNSYGNLELWKEKFPRESWILQGFALMSLYDATVENAVSILKEKLLQVKTSGLQQSMETIFRSIYRNAGIRVGYTAYNEEESSFSNDVYGRQMQSFILPNDGVADVREALCVGSYHLIVEEKTYFAVSDTAEFLKQNPLSQLGKRFLAQGIQSFILAPVVRNQQLLGVLEVVSTRPRELNSINANKLEVVMPYLTDTIERRVAELQDQVQAVIYDRYTAIHPSVHWMFRAEAQKLISNRLLGRDYTPQEIVLPEVYPLYGQVDIKGSSEIRSQCVQQDLQNQLKALQSLIEGLVEYDIYGAFLEEMPQLKGLLEELSLPFKSGTEQLINEYLNTHIHPRLKQISKQSNLTAIQNYFSQTEKEQGEFHFYRRRYQSTISLINQKLSEIIDARQSEAQAIFPHYYERFKTDGVEHDLYVGSSVSPKQRFSSRMLQRLRLWQLQVLCEMEVAHHHAKPELPYPLEVTTLVMVYSTPITLRFRMDERRFDVDGSYSAQFEIVKKRVDKAHVKGKTKRITEVGKLTVVYSSEAEGEEYLGLINQLQKKGTLGKEIKQFEVEELPGAIGLKAFQIDISHA